MSLISNEANVAFATAFSIDKIVDVWEGNYNRATQVTVRSYTYLGAPYNVYFYRIPHGFNRPVFCDLLWSTDGVTYVDGGSASTSFSGVSIAFSDSTYIYIYDSQGAAAAGTARYKVIAFWIDNYDTTNPAVNSFLSPNGQTNFDSRLNYQKISQQAASNFTFTSGVLSEPTNVVGHTLGYRPNFRVFFEAFPGEVWPMQYGGTTNPFNFADIELECRAKVSTTALSITLTHPVSSTITAARAWYRMYLDH